MRFVHSRIFLGTLLCLLTLAGFFPVVNHPFVIYDDDEYVTYNPDVQRGLSYEGVRWAFTTPHAANWHPLTWLSHMLDVELYALEPRGHHVTNLVLHVANAVLLFLVLSWMTQPLAAPIGATSAGGSTAGSQGAKALWSSFFVAALFAIHPLHVEPVAWVAQRKELLAGLFWFLTLGAYLRYTRNPSVARYVLVLFSLGLGLMAKPVLVTLPLVLLLLDYWPLGRFLTAKQDRTANRRVVLEKLPLLALSAASCVVTLVVQAQGGAVKPLTAMPFLPRVGNALLAYVGYLSKTLWPSGLACFYPHFSKTGELTASGALGAAFLLFAITVALVVFGRERRYLVVGWLWFLGTLVPMIGLVQVGVQGMADRYTYLPLIGLFLMFVWTVADLRADWGRYRVPLALAAACVVGVNLLITWSQLRHWHDSVSLFRRAVQVAPSEIAHGNLGIALVQLKTPENLKKAVNHLQVALRMDPDLAKVRIDLGNALVQLGYSAEAVTHYEVALRRLPDHPGLHNNLGSALASLGKFDEAARQFQEVLRLLPRDAVAHRNLANVFEEQGKLDKAVEQYTEAIQLRPGQAIDHKSLAQVLNRQGKTRDALLYYRAALRLQPDFSEVRNNLAWILATHPEPEFRNGDEAVELAEQTCRATGYQQPAALDTLAAAYAEVGRFEEAVQTAGQAARLARESGDVEMAIGIEGRLSLYREAKPFRDVPTEE